MAIDGGPRPSGLAELEEAIGLAESRLTACARIVDRWVALDKAVDAERVRGLGLSITTRLDRLHLERLRLLGGTVGGTVT